MSPRVLPFAGYMGFLGIAALLSSTAFGLSEEALLWLYPIKIAFVSALLALYSKYYEELKTPFGRWRELLLSVLVGALVYLAWVRMDFSWAAQGEAGSGYRPQLAGPFFGPLLIGIRLFGAAIIVPIMEELFWRSFILRYTISSDFSTVKLGTYAPLSFLATLVLFGLEHHLWLAGMMAGAAYSLLLYRTGQLWPVIFAHGTTNLLLGAHVLLKAEWFWW